MMEESETHASIDVEPAYFETSNKGGLGSNNSSRSGTWDVPGPTPTDWVERAT